MAHSQNSDNPGTAQDALVAIMIATSLSDGSGKTSELVTINELINHLPVFAEYDEGQIRKMTHYVLDLFGREDGLSTFFGAVREVLPSEYAETAYTLACDVAAGDGRLPQIELRFLQEIRHELNVDRLAAAAIERAAGARYKH